MSCLFRIFVYAETETELDSLQVAGISFACFMGLTIIVSCVCVAKKSGETQADSSNTNDARSSFENPLRKFILCKVDSDFD